MGDDEEIVDIVDENNLVIGKSSRKEAHLKGHIHRALSVLVLNSKGQILLQKRSEKKSVHPLSWDLSTSEHVLSGESYEDAGVRSLREELGIESIVKKVTATTLQIRKYEINGQIVHEKEIVLMLTSFYEGPFEVNTNEVHSAKFFSVEEIEKMVKNGEDFTVWFLDEWENVKKVIGNQNK